MTKKGKFKYAFFILILLISIFIFTYISIVIFSKNYSEKTSDTAIVLGAGSHNGLVSPIFRERLNHSIFLYEKGIVKNIIITGGYGENEKIADSEAGLQYVLGKQVPIENIFIEKVSTKTYENFIEAKKIMIAKNLKTALIVSDPFHMKRAIYIAKNQNIICESSPTQTSMYKSFTPKFSSLMHESYYYLLGLFRF